MPTITEITAFDWNVDMDLEAASLFAGAYRCRYNQVDGVQAWDNQHFANLRIYRGGADPDQVRIRGDFDGVIDTIIQGIVDRNGIAEDKGSRIGQLIGRDVMAVVLDTHPTGFTIPRGTTAQAAVAMLCAQAGLALIWDAQTYPLGRDVAVTSERTVGEWIDDLLVPLRWPERHRVDAWVDSNVLYVADRMNFTRGDCTLPYDRVTLDLMEETALPSGVDVYVEGATFDVLVPVPAGSITSTTRTNTTQAGSGADLTTTTETVTDWFDTRGRNFRRDRYVNTTVTTGGVTVRSTLETEFMVAAFLDGGAYATNVEGKRASETVTATKTREDGLTGTFKSITRSWSYDADGEVSTERTDEQEYDVDAGTPAIYRSTQYNYYRGGPQVNRTWDIQEADAATGAVIRHQGQSEVGAGSLPNARLDPVPFGYRRQTQRYHSSGNPNARRRESSDLLGSDASCTILANLIAEDYAYNRVRAQMKFPPSLDVKPGKRFTVTSAPGSWKASAFYVLSMSASRSGKNASMTVEGVAWITPA